METCMGTHRPTHSNVHHSAEKLLRSITSRKYKSLHAHKQSAVRTVLHRGKNQAYRVWIGTAVRLLQLEYQTFPCQSRPFLCLHQCVSDTDIILMHYSTVMRYKLYYCKQYNNMYIVSMLVLCLCMCPCILIFPFPCIQCKPHSRQGSVFPWQPVCSQPPPLSPPSQQALNFHPTASGLQ